MGNFSKIRFKMTAKLNEYIVNDVRLTANYF